MALVELHVQNLQCVYVQPLICLLGSKLYELCPNSAYYTQTQPPLFLVILSVSLM